MNDIDKNFLSNIFSLFAGLYGYYSLQRLFPLKLFQIEKILSTGSLFATKRLFLGFIANILVAISFAGAIFWFNFLIAPHTFATTLQKIAGVSIAISSSSLLLIPHRIIGTLVILFKNKLFEEDFDFEKDYHIFLNSCAWKNFIGAALFILYQLLIGLLMKFIITI